MNAFITITQFFIVGVFITLVWKYVGALDTMNKQFPEYTGNDLFGIPPTDVKENKKQDALFELTEDDVP